MSPEMSRRTWLWAALLAVLGAVVYLNSLGVPFHLDDAHSIHDNTWIRSFKNLPLFFSDVRTFSPLAENRSYRPLLLVTYAISWALGGGAVEPFHAISILLHAGMIAMVYFTLRRLLAETGVEGRTLEALALFGGALFAVHPLMSESVVYISARSSLMAAFFYLAGFLAYVRAREAGRDRDLWLVSLLLVLGLFTKLIAITLPAVLLLWELFIGPEGDRRAGEGGFARALRKLERDGLGRWFLRIGVPGLLGLAFAVLHESVVGDQARQLRSLISPYSYLLTEIRVYLRYLGLFVWPEDLSADLTMQWSHAFWEGEAARAILANLVLIAVAAALLRRQPLVLFGLLWFYVSLAPTSSVMPLSEPATEHRMAIAMPGLVFMAMGLFAALRHAVLESPRRTQAALFAATLALGILAGRTVLRNRVWQTERALWADVRDRSPDNGRAHLNYGLALMGAGDYDGARQAFEACKQAWPYWPFCYINRAVLALREKRLLDAEREILEAERLRADNVYVQFWKGEVMRALGRNDVAELAYRRALQGSPGYAFARRGLALALFELARVDEAKPMFEALEAERFLDADSCFAIGFLAQRDGQLDRAVVSYQEALRQQPTHAKALYNLAVLHQAAGRFADAIPLYKRMVDANVADDNALYNYTLALWKAGDLEGARQIREKLRARNAAYQGLASLQF